MRVLITGAYGQVGHDLLRLTPEGFEAHGLSSTELDITNAAQLVTVIDKLQPQLIINAAAYTAMDKAEAAPERAWAVNRNGVAHLAMAAERLGIPVFHISTDYVFSGDAHEPYRETDSTAPTNDYGASKLGGGRGSGAGGQLQSPHHPAHQLGIRRTRQQLHQDYAVLGPRAQGAEGDG